MNNVKVAAKWWREALKTPKFSALSDEERLNPDSLPLSIAEGIAISNHRSPEEDKTNIFESSLREIIKKELESRGDSVLILSVDYSPDQYLSDALELAGISCNHLDNVLPWKTIMWITPYNISVKCGYAANSEIIWRK
jgi:hypothetical protein